VVHLLAEAILVVDFHLPSSHLAGASRVSSKGWHRQRRRLLPTRPSTSWWTLSRWSCESSQTFHREFQTDQHLDEWTERLNHWLIDESHFICPCECAAAELSNAKQGSNHFLTKMKKKKRKIPGQLPRRDGIQLKKLCPRLRD